MYPLKNVKTKWSVQLAYCIGLISSDGNLSKNGRHISFVSKDIQLIHLFCKCLCIKPKISIKNGGYGAVAYFVQFSDVNFYKFMVSIGLTANKSKTIGKIKIPVEYMPDFLRGSFDGDGTFYSYFDKRWDKSFMYYLVFISASLDHLHWIRGFLKEKLEITGALSVYYYQRATQLRYGKKEALKIIDYIYYGRDIPKLERKYLKVYNALAIDTENNNARVL